jgi:hypothetical protein
MAILVIKDLPENVDLDRQAMAAITGGARVRGSQSSLGRTTFRSTRVMNYPTSFASEPLTNWRLAGSTTPK